MHQDSLGGPETGAILKERLRQVIGGCSDVRYSCPDRHVARPVRLREIVHLHFDDIGSSAFRHLQADPVKLCARRFVKIADLYGIEVAMTVDITHACRQRTCVGKHI